MPTLPEIYHLLYGFDEFFGHRPESIHPHDSPTFRVHLIPFQLGREFRDADPTESLFHVEFYPPDRAELWNAKAWADSLTKRLRAAGQVATYYRTPKEDSRLQLEAAFLKHFRSIGLPFRHARALSELLISGPENPSVLQLAALPEELAHTLKVYRTNEQSENRSEDPSPRD